MDRKDVCGEGQLSVAPNEKKSKWLLITQFYEDSVHRYGPDSDQARALSTARGPAVCDETDAGESQQGLQADGVVWPARARGLETIAE